jgi:nucleotide-binding universal stress UspA family protein
MGRDYLERVQSRLQQGGLKTHTEVLIGKVPDEIVKYAEESNVDLLVMTTHGYSGFTRWELGSVSDQVLHAVSIPVFLVRSQK